MLGLKINIPLNIEEFMNLFMHDYYPVLKGNIFADAASPFPTEAEMYQYITDKINGSKIIDSSKLVCAFPLYKSDQDDATWRHDVDLGSYPTQGDSEYNRHVNWSHIDLSIECKVDPTDQDPFDETTDDFQPRSAGRKKALNQMLTYVENVFMHQHRTLHYMILFLGHYARIVRFDHSGVYATIKFNYQTKGAILTTFLARYSHYNTVMRGHDPTAHRLERRDPLKAKMRQFGLAKAAEDKDDHAQQMFNASLDNAWPWHKLEVHVQPTTGDPEPPLGRLRSSRPERITRSFVVGKPQFNAGGVVGRGTRGYVAVEVDSRGELVGSFVYLKDVWRVDHPGIEQEGAVLETLNHHEVPFVPTLVCHGDLEGQVTMSQDAWARRRVQHPRVKRTFKRHQHYRLVVAEVGKPLEQFGSGFNLVSAVYCCLLAHQAAYEKAGIIHRDISSGNILLYKSSKGNWLGLLNDWELSKRVDAPAARQPDRTGTWQFMSAKALNDPDKEIGIEDEIEALFHVLLYHAVRFLPHNIDPDCVPNFLEDYFDGCCTRNDEYCCGLAKLGAMENGVIKITTYNSASASLKFVQRDDANRVHLIDGLFARLLCSFKEAYALDPATMPGQEPSQVKSSEDVDAFWADLKAMPNVTRKELATPPKPNKGRPKGKPRASRPSQRRGKRKIATHTHATSSRTAISDDSLKPISLKEHSPVVELFEYFMMQKDWPTDDKGDDLRVKGRKIVDADEVFPSNPDNGGSKSRKRQLDDPPPAAGTSKRSRV